MAKRTRDLTVNTNEEANPKWSHDQTMLFIKLFKKQEHLWDRGHPEYRRSAPRQKSMNEICAVLNVPTKDLAKQIHRLQSKFNSIWRKCKDGSDKGAASRTTWPYYEHLRFMEKSYRILDESRDKKKRKKRAQTHKRTTTRIASRSDSEFDGFPKVEHETIISDEEDNFSDDCYIACSSTAVSAESFASSNTISMKYETETATSLSTTAATTTTPSMTAQSNNRIDVFFKAMADTVKSFPAKSVAQAKLQISQIVGEMELSLASEDEVLVASF